MSHSDGGQVQGVRGGESRMSAVAGMPAQHRLINVRIWLIPVPSFLC